MMVATWIFSGLLFATVMAAIWDEPNRWKFWSILVAVMLLSAGLRLTSYIRGYADGQDDMVCEISEAYERRDIPVTTENVECP